MLKFMLPIIESPKEAFCTYPFQNLYVNVAGTVSCCCHMREPLGNVLEDDLITIWTGAKYKELRAAILRRKLPRACTTGHGSCPWLGRDLQKVQLSPISYDPNRPRWLELPLPNTHCNIGGEEPHEKNKACIMCIRDRKDFRDNHPQYRMDKTDEIVAACKSAIPYLSALSIMGIAEPFWHGRVMDVMEQLDYPNHKKTCNFSTFTNGICLNEAMIERFLGMVVRGCLNWSIDAASPETFVAIRRKNAFDVIKKNAKLFNNMRDSSKMRFSVANNINLLNVHEMALMVDFAKEVGADWVSLGPTWNAPWMQQLLISEDNKHVFFANRDKAVARAKEIGIDLRGNLDFENFIPTPK